MRKYVYPLEIALAAWVAVWIVTGWLVYREVQGLAKLGQTVVLWYGWLRHQTAGSGEDGQMRTAG